MSPTTIADPALIPDIEAYDERVAIHIYEGDIPIDQAKDPSAQAQGFRNQAHYWAWLRVMWREIGGASVTQIRTGSALHGGWVTSFQPS